MESYDTYPAKALCKCVQDHNNKCFSAPIKKIRQVNPVKMGELLVKMK